MSQINLFSLQLAQSVYYAVSHREHTLYTMVKSILCSRVLGKNYGGKKGVCELKAGGRMVLIMKKSLHLSLLVQFFKVTSYITLHH